MNIYRKKSADNETTRTGETAVVAEMTNFLGQSWQKNPKPFGWGNVRTMAKTTRTTQVSREMRERMARWIT